MELHLKAFKPNKRFIHFKVLIGKVKCGELCMKKEDAFHFVDVLRTEMNVKLTGNWK